MGVVSHTTMHILTTFSGQIHLDLLTDLRLTLQAWQKITVDANSSLPSSSMLLLLLFYH